MSHHCARCLPARLRRLTPNSLRQYLRYRQHIQLRPPVDRISASQEVCSPTYSSVLICLSSDDVDEGKIQLNKVARNNLGIKLGDLCSVHACHDIKYGKRIHVLPFDESIEGLVLPSSSSRPTSSPVPDSAPVRARLPNRASSFNRVVCSKFDLTIRFSDIENPGTRCLISHASS
ncbi:hypothetical protein EXIGLDRAFT_766109 [Exidia glandulosa HHB12029]|uniref:CDC48 N-terminal subdomain domain-containing protein n=1 Tax=Exidia glandulosa HHB12029 TaxID=1314781 RepID=A0A165IWD0_EXIGL|nr:hypothetical protein EXIGLDRAFT_767515 [Exidia glandulosa HHB12029]KZV95545.1 hypothetical protein EXIGLDRAFT_766109 [Exidia glandulosa HHB12029]